VLGEFEGSELSILTFIDGVAFKSMPPAQDHQQIPMAVWNRILVIGCYAPTKIATPEVIREIQETVLRPTFEGMRKEGEASCGT
jgi:phosphoribosylamine-glycine ligase